MENEHEQAFRVRERPDDCLRRCFTGAPALRPARTARARTETSSTVAAAPWTVPRTADGQPDLQGVWLNTSATPFERPEALAGREFLTDDEVAELSRRASRIFKENDADLAIGDALYLAALADVDAFRRQGANRSSNFMVEREFDNRTSQIVDPPDGRLPALLPAGGREAGGVYRPGPGSGRSGGSQPARPLRDAGDAAHRPRGPVATRCTATTRFSSRRGISSS